MKLERTASNIVRALFKARRKERDIWQLARECGYLPDCLRAIESLQKMGAVKTRDSMVTLTNTRALPKSLLKKQKPVKEVLRAYEKILKGARFADTSFDQLMITPEAVGHKLALMDERNDLADRDILCLGDDDLFSVACSLTELPRSITVVDIDENLLAFIESLSPKLPVRIRTLSLNLATPLPKRFYNAFDVFITEPPETAKATLLFVKQGLNALRKGGAFYLGVVESMSSTRDRREIEKALVEAGVVFTDILRDREEYPVEGNELDFAWSRKLPAWVKKLPKEPWFVSTLFRGELVEKKRLQLPRVTAKDLRTGF